MSAEKGFSSSMLFRVFLFAAIWVLFSSAFSGLLIYSWAKVRIDRQTEERGQSAARAPGEGLPERDASLRVRMLSGLLRKAALGHVFAMVFAQAAGIGLLVFLIRRGRPLGLDLPERGHLRGLFPICSHCNRIREGEDSWRHIESYIQKNSRARFTHCICPECSERHYSQFDLYNRKLPRAG